MSDPVRVVLDDDLSESLRLLNQSMGSAMTRMGRASCSRVAGEAQGRAVLPRPAAQSADHPSVAMSLSALSPEQLRQLRARPDIGDAYREKIDAQLSSGPVGVHETMSKNGKHKSTDPRDRMNQTERRMADVLDMRVRNGEVSRWVFEGLKLRLAGNTWFTPDFFVQLVSGAIEIVEVKGGFIREDARLKWKIAREMYPGFTWRMKQWADGEWKTLYDFGEK